MNALNEGTQSSVPPKVGQSVTGKLVKAKKPKQTIKIKITPKLEAVAFDIRFPTLGGVMQANLSVAQAHDLYEALGKLLS